MNTGYVFQHGCLRDEKLLSASVMINVTSPGGLGTVGSNNYKLKLNSQIRLQVLLPKTKISLTTLNLAPISNLDNHAQSPAPAEGGQHLEDTGAQRRAATPGHTTTYGS